MGTMECEQGVDVDELDAGLLMWDMRRNLNLEPMPRRRRRLLRRSSR